MDILALVDYATRLLVVILVGVFSYEKNFVDLSGFIMGIIICTPIIILGGWNWFLIILLFYITANIATRFKYDAKKAIGVAEEKGGARSWKSVLANGVAGLTALMIEKIIGGQIWALGYLGAIAAALGDTLASEIGVLNPTPPRLIVRPWTKVKPGTSGAVSPLGYLMIIISGLTIGITGVTLNVVPEIHANQYLLIIFIITIASLVGSTIDSILGASIQARYRCVICGIETDRKIHCGKKAVRIGGVEFIDNNVVNVIGTMSGCLFAVLLGIPLGFK